MRSWIKAGAMSLLAAPAAAETPLAEILCEPTSRLSEKLAVQHGGARFARGTQGPDQILEVWTDERGNWTLVVTYATGVSCIVAMGENWDRLTRDNPA